MVELETRVNSLDFIITVGRGQREREWDNRVLQISTADHCGDN
jgi:hypothetical protein